jgi:hypothetical protein
MNRALRRRRMIRKGGGINRMVGYHGIRVVKVGCDRVQEGVFLIVSVTFFLLSFAFFLPVRSTSYVSTLNFSALFFYYNHLL